MEEKVKKTESAKEREQPKEVKKTESAKEREQPKEVKKVVSEAPPLHVLNEMARKGAAYRRKVAEDKNK